MDDARELEAAFTEALISICKKNVKFENELHLNATIAITADKHQALPLNICEIITVVKGPGNKTPRSKRLRKKRKTSDDSFMPLVKQENVTSFPVKSEGEVKIKTEFVEEKVFGGDVCEEAGNHEGKSADDLQVTTRDTSKDTITCMFCSKQLLSRSFYRHMSTKHKIISDNIQYQKQGRQNRLKNIKHVCKICKQVFPSRRAKLVHRKLEHKELSVKCHLCQKTFCLRGNLIVHMRNVHSDVPYTIPEFKLMPTCKFCGVQFRFRNKLQLHHDRHHSGIKFPCSKCGKEFTNRETRNHHQKHVKCDVNPIKRASIGGGPKTLDKSVNGNQATISGPSSIVGALHAITTPSIVESQTVNTATDSSQQQANVASFDDSHTVNTSVAGLRGLDALNTPQSAHTVISMPDDLNNVSFGDLLNNGVMPPTSHSTPGPSVLPESHSVMDTEGGVAGPSQSAERMDDDDIQIAGSDMDQDDGDENWEMEDTLEYSSDESEADAKNPTPSKRNSSVNPSEATVESSHFTVVKQGNVYQCAFCAEELVSESLYRDHMESVHSFTNPDFKTPIKNESKKKHLCPLCNKQLSGRKARLNHIKNEHSHTTVSCPFCQQVFCLFRNLKAHINRSHNDIPFVMPDYQKRFECEICGADFSCKSILNEHLGVKHKQDPRVCPTCGRTVYGTENLTRHMKSHKESFNGYTCKVCGRRYVSHDHYVKHENTCTGKKKSVSSDLSFSCHYCGHMFKRKHHVERHINDVHEKVTECVCKICGREFKRRDNYLLHLRKTHTIDLGERFNNWKYDSIENS